MLAAPAAGAREFVRRHPGQGVVAPFAGDAVARLRPAAVDDDAAADAGADDHREDQAEARRRRRPPPRSPRGSWRRWRGAPGGRGARSRSRVERLAIQPGGVGAADQARRGDSAAGNADADRRPRSPSSASAASTRLARSRRGCRRSRAGVGARRRSSTRPIRTEGDDLDLGAAEIDSDAPGHGGKVTRARPGRKRAGRGPRAVLHSRHGGELRCSTSRG